MQGFAMVQKKVGARYEGYRIGNIAVSYRQFHVMLAVALQVPENCSMGETVR